MVSSRHGILFLDSFQYTLWFSFTIHAGSVIQKKMKCQNHKISVDLWIVPEKSCKCEKSWYSQCSKLMIFNTLSADKSVFQAFGDAHARGLQNLEVGWLNSFVRWGWIFFCCYNSVANRNALIRRSILKFRVATWRGNNSLLVFPPIFGVALPDKSRFSM